MSLRSKFTQKLGVLASECTHARAHFVCVDEVQSFIFERESGLHKLAKLDSGMGLSPNATWCTSMLSAQEEVPLFAYCLSSVLPLFSNLNTPFHSLSLTCLCFCFLVRASHLLQSSTDSLLIRHLLQLLINTQIWH